MRQFILFAILFVLGGSAFGQLSVTAWNPADGTTGVPTTATLSITFSGAIDTTQKLGDDGLGIITNIDTLTAEWYSTDRQTVYFNVRLGSNRVYFVCIYWVPGVGGTNLTNPSVMTFTTASAFPTPGYQVSGTVSGGTSGFSPAYSLVALADGPMTEGKPNIIIGTLANASGLFSFSGIPAGTYWPLAIKDGNGDGYLDPTGGDPLGTGDSIKVVNAAVTDINLVYTVVAPVSFHESLEKSGTIPSSTLPSDKTLLMCYCWDVDTTGRASHWNFYYSSASTGKYYIAEVGPMDLHVDSVTAPDAQWFKDKRPITAPATAARSESVIVHAENAGGRAWRYAANPGGGAIFKLSMSLMDMRTSQFTGLLVDPSKNYWGVEYEFGTYPRPDSFAQIRVKRFIADFTTGEIISASTAVDDDSPGAAPSTMVLSQNYPNPFNPTTTVSWQLPEAAKVRLTVYDLLGRQVALLANETQEAGVHMATWNALGMASGVYYYRLETGGRSEMKKMVLMK
jgi:hypothetical protein